MKSDAATIDEYLAKLPDDRRAALGAVLKVMRRNMPKGYVEAMNGGMICWQVPLEVYSDTSNKQPLLYAALASQKNHMAIYMCSVYAIPELREQLEEGYARAGIRLDCGIGCIRFRKLHHVALPVIGKLARALSVKEFVAHTKKIDAERGTRKGAVES